MPVHHLCLYACVLHCIGTLLADGNGAPAESRPAAKGLQSAAASGGLEAPDATGAATLYVKDGDGGCGGGGAGEKGMSLQGGTIIAASPKEGRPAVALQVMLLPVEDAKAITSPENLAETSSRLKAMRPKRVHS